MACAETDIEKIAKGWSIAMRYSKKRIQEVRKLDDEALEDVISDGHLVLETTCLFVHACVKQGQYRLPLEFWKILDAECGITVYPSALTEDIDIRGVGEDRMFMDAYAGHITMTGRWAPPRPFPDPFEYLQEPPPVYQKDCPCHCRLPQADRGVGETNKGN